jgi:hypothetical protein
MPLIAAKATHVAPLSAVEQLQYYEKVVATLQSQLPQYRVKSGVAIKPLLARICAWQRLDPLVRTDAFADTNNWLRSETDKWADAPKAA